MRLPGDLPRFTGTGWGVFDWTRGVCSILNQTSIDEVQQRTGSPHPPGSRIGRWLICLGRVAGWHHVRPSLAGEGGDKTGRPRQWPLLLPAHPPMPLPPPNPRGTQLLRQPGKLPNSSARPLLTRSPPRGGRGGIVPRRTTTWSPKCAAFPSWPACCWWG